jgi:hypothetical protein
MVMGKKIAGVAAVFALLAGGAAVGQDRNLPVTSEGSLTMLGLTVAFLALLVVTAEDAAKSD